MDGKEKRIVEMLIDDGRVKLNRIARKTGIPVTTVYNRLRALQKSGTVRIKAEPDLKKLGYGIEFFVLATVDTSDRNVNQDEIAKRLVGMPNIIDAFVITGSRDMIIRAVARNVDEMSELVLKKIRDIKGIASTETMVVLKSERADMKKFLH